MKSLRIDGHNLFTKYVSYIHCKFYYSNVYIANEVRHI